MTRTHAHTRTLRLYRRDSDLLLAPDGTEMEIPMNEQQNTKQRAVVLKVATKCRFQMVPSERHAGAFEVDSGGDMQRNLFRQIAAEDPQLERGMLD